MQRIVPAGLRIGDAEYTLQYVVNAAGSLATIQKKWIDNAAAASLASTRPTRRTNNDRGDSTPLLLIL